MRKLGAGIFGLLCLAAIAGCTTNKNIANVTTPGVKLVVSVGTINDNAGTLGIGGVTLNVVSSFRNVLGNSAYQNPGWFSFDGPSGNIIPSQPGNPCDQLFSYGEFSVFFACQTDSNFSVLNGVPPAYNPPNSLGGYSMGFIQTGAPLTNGSYTLSTVVPVNGQNVHYSANASLTSVVMANATGVTSFVSDGLGGGTFTIGNPAKPHGKRVHHDGGPPPAAEALIVVENLFLSSSGGVIVATVETNGTTATVVGTGDCSSSAGGNPIPCGSNVAYVIEADYPMVEAGPPASHAVTPTLTGANGQSDISVSAFTGINE